MKIAPKYNSLSTLQKVIEIMYQVKPEERSQVLSILKEIFKDEKTLPIEEEYYNVQD